MLLVPMKLGEKIKGVIVLSSLGYGKFDEEDQRLLEVLASHAAVALENAELFQSARQAAETSASLLRLSQTMTGKHTVGDILQLAVESVPELVPCAAAGAYVLDADTGDYRLARLHEVIEGVARPRAEIGDVSRDVAAAFLFADLDPFVIPEEVVRQLPPELYFVHEPADVLAAPLRWEPDGNGALALVAEPGTTPFGGSQVRMLRGIADITSLALGNARRLSELERFHELVETLDAGFWEADAATLAFTFVGGRANEMTGSDATAWPVEGMTWGDHIAASDRPEALATLNQAVEAGEDRRLEYRMETPAGETVWIRDLIHIVRGAQRARQLRGLMVDVTERRARGAGTATERAEVLRGLPAGARGRATPPRARRDEEHVPRGRLPRPADPADVDPGIRPHAGAGPRSRSVARTRVDLVRRIAANARKLERLLSDLLDLDRLQRGIVTPQRRPTDLQDLVRRGIEETENPAGHVIEVDVEPITVSVDGAKVERILENLLSNAIRHTRAGDADLGPRARPRTTACCSRWRTRDPASPRTCTRPSSNPSGRHPAPPPCTRPASAWGCRSCCGSPNSTAAGRGWRIDPAAARSSRCSCPAVDPAAVGTTQI